RVRVVVAARAGALVDVVGPGVVFAACVGENADGAAQLFVAGPAEAGDFLFARLDGDRGLAGDRFERAAGGVAFSAVADLGEQFSGGDDGLGSRKSERKMWPSVWASRAPAIWLVRSLICSTSGLSAATSASTTARRASVSSSAALPVGASRSLASSSVGLRRPE